MSLWRFPFLPLETYTPRNALSEIQKTVLLCFIKIFIARGRDWIEGDFIISPGNGESTLR
jgi:hypothetical protein